MAKKRKYVSVFDRMLGQHRYETLLSEDFTRAEAMRLAEFEFKYPYIKLMRQERQALVRSVDAMGLSGRDRRSMIIKRIKEEYATYGWVDAYAMMRYYRKQLIDIGSYAPPVRPPRHRTTQENVARQNLRYKAKRERLNLSGTMPANKEQWIRELDANIAKATGKRREQLQAQRDRLAG